MGAGRTGPHPSRSFDTSRLSRYTTPMHTHTTNFDRKMDDLAGTAFCILAFPWWLLFVTLCYITLLPFALAAWCWARLDTSRL